MADARENNASSNAVKVATSANNKGTAAVSAKVSESGFISTVLAVLKEEETVEKAIKLMERSNMGAWTIGFCVCEAVDKLPQSDTWEEVEWNMITNEDTMDSRDRVIPMAEKRLFELLLAIHGNDEVKGDRIVDCCKTLFRKRMYDANISTADVARIWRLFFFALILVEKSNEERVKQAHEMFIILLRQSSQAVCQSLTYLLCQSQTASLASEMLKMELDYEEDAGSIFIFPGLLISVHMNNKDSEVLYWAIDKFADKSCKKQSNAAFKTLALFETVEGWWNSDMQLVETVRDQADAMDIQYNLSIQKVDKSIRKHMDRMILLISHKFEIEGLDRVKLLAQLDATAIAVIDRATDDQIGHIGAQLDDGETRVIRVKLYLAECILRSFFNYGQFLGTDDEREALRLHLASLSQKVESILKREWVMETRSPKTPLDYGIDALRNWRDNVQCLTNWDLMVTASTSDLESGPAKKSARKE